MLTALILWLLFGIFSAVIASNKGRSGIGWFFVGVFFGPFGLLVAVLPAQEKVDALPAQQKQTEKAKEVAVTEQKSEFSTERFVKRCPSCAERIKLEALVCRFCGHTFEPEDIQVGIQWAKKEFERKELEKRNTLTPEQKEKMSRGLCPNCDAYQAFKTDRDRNRLTCEVCKSQYPLDEEKRTQTQTDEPAAAEEPIKKASAAKTFLVVISAIFGLIVLGSLFSSSGQQKQQKQQKLVQFANPSVTRAERKALLQKLINKGIFTKVAKPGSLPRVYVAPTFYVLDFDTKQTFVGVVYAYYFGENPDGIVAVYDGLSGKEIGAFSVSPKYGFPGLKLD